jgi:endo-1,3(4)-beta-glucanase
MPASVPPSRSSAAAGRVTGQGSRELDTAAGGKPRVWGDLFAADLAIADPAAARKRLDAGVPREESTSRGLVRYWVEALAVLGPPPLGSLDFASAGRVTAP